ncbi:uncharacterized protein LOC134840081 [Symsagittifera roscoffensis]|uniref:uncharacterized protein LOC134840081 n=1 Tax=Symsagittifera roscoffensis TaxID=84072 RepID=UPI00307B5119
MKSALGAKLILFLFSFLLLPSIVSTASSMQWSVKQELGALRDLYHYKAGNLYISRECYVCFQNSCLQMSLSSEPTCIMNIVTTTSQNYINFQPCPTTCKFVRDYFRFSLRERQHFSLELNKWAEYENNIVELKRPTTEEQDTVW